MSKLRSQVSRQKSDLDHLRSQQPGAQRRRFDPSKAFQHDGSKENQQPDVPALGLREGEDAGLPPRSLSVYYLTRSLFALTGERAEWLTAYNCLFLFLSQGTFICSWIGGGGGGGGFFKQS